MIATFHRHPLLLLTIRALLGIWLLIATVVLCASGHWWGLLIIVPMVLNVYLALRVARSA